MDIKAYRSHLTYLINKKNSYLMLAMGFMILSLILAGLLFKSFNSERVIVVPPSIHEPFWISGNAVSPEYIDQMSRFFAMMRLTIDGGTAEYQHETILHHVAPSFYNSMKANLAKEREKLKKHHLATAFYPTKTKVDQKDLTAVVIGDLKTYVGDEQKGERQAAFQIQYERNGDHLLMASFKEVKVHG